MIAVRDGRAEGEEDKAERLWSSRTTERLSHVMMSLRVSVKAGPRPNLKRPERLRARTAVMQRAAMAARRERSISSRRGEGASVAQDSVLVA